MDANPSGKLNEEAFWDWLKQRITPKQLSEMYHYDWELKQYFNLKYGHALSIFYETLRTSHARVRNSVGLPQRNYE